MAGVTFDLDSAAFARAFASLNYQQLVTVVDAVGALIEDQTKLRIEEDKAAPDGSPWSAWSAAYDETRNHAVHSLLIGEGNLRESIQNYSTGLVATVGTPLIYGAHQQFGSADDGSPVAAGATGDGIPARPYLGLSSANIDDINDLVIGQVRRLLQ
jgi:phage virion morphogenesis protein